MELEWRKEPPTEAGFYWYRCMDPNVGKKFRPLVVEVDWIKYIDKGIPDTTSRLYVSWPGCEYDFNFHHYPGEEWAGPIPLPKEPNTVFLDPYAATAL